MTPQPHSSRPSLEEVIRIKRAERPPAEFWQRFEQELRAKQLAAIVAPRPWWRPLAGLLSGRRATVAGFGAVAAVAAVAYLRLPSNQAMVDAQDSTASISSPALAATNVRSAAETMSAGPVVQVAAVSPQVSSPGEISTADNSAKSEDQRREATGSSSVVNPMLVAVKFSEIQVLPPRSAMELTVPVTTLAFSTSARTEVGSSEPLAAIPTPREQSVARFASVAELAMLATPAVASLRSKPTPRDADLRERDLGRLLTQGNALGLRF